MIAVLHVDTLLSDRGGNQELHATLLSFRLEDSRVNGHGRVDDHYRDLVRHKLLTDLFT